MMRVQLFVPAGDENTRFAQDADLNIDGSTPVVVNGQRVGTLVKQIAIAPDGRYAVVEAEIDGFLPW